MVTGYPTISNPKETIPTTFGGDVMNVHQEYAKGTNVAASDPTKKRTIGTETRYKDGMLQVYMTNQVNTLKFLSPNMPTNVSLSFPTNMDSVDPNEYLFREVAAEIENKVIDGTKNTILNVINAIAKQVRLINETTEPVATTLQSPFYRKDIDVNNQAIYISKLENGVAVKVRVA